MKPYIQAQNKQSTLGHWKEILAGNELRSFAAFAYVTDSGVAQVETHLGPAIGASRKCRWLFGIDYGRSHPSALRRLTKIAKSAIRIYDGEYVTHAKGFVPRVTFHLKTALTLQKNGYPSQQIVGSGNLSASGLLGGIEAGCVVDYTDVDHQHGNEIIEVLEEMWDEATPLDEIIDDYESQYEELIQPQVFAAKPKVSAAAGTDLFWIDVGYVTKNRGPDRPGNQFDLPRGSHVFLGVKEVKNPALNSVLANLNIKTPGGAAVERSLRYGNNSMEKLTLPIPEENGFECYDGKILTFEVKKGAVILRALEHDDFFQVYGQRISSCSEMQSGRRYGTVLLLQ